MAPFGPNTTGFLGDIFLNEAGVRNRFVRAVCALQTTQQWIFEFQLGLVAIGCIALTLFVLETRQVLFWSL